MGENGSSSFVVVVLFATFLVAPIVADKRVNVDLPTFEALMNMNGVGAGKVNKGYTDYCCKTCICALIYPPVCQCMDVFVGGCPSECKDQCICTKSIPPPCRCVKVDVTCPVKSCLTSPQLSE